MLIGNDSVLQGWKSFSRWEQPHRCPRSSVRVPWLCTRWPSVLQHCRQLMQHHLHQHHRWGCSLLCRDGIYGHKSERAQRATNNYHYQQYCLPCLSSTSLLQVYLGEQYVNSTTLSDVTFMVEGELCSLLCSPRQVDSGLVTCGVLRRGRSLSLPTLAQGPPQPAVNTRVASWRQLMLRAQLGPHLTLLLCADCGTGTRFYAHRIALLASSDAFRAMFDGGYRVGSGAPWFCAGLRESLATFVAGKLQRDGALVPVSFALFDRCLHHRQFHIVQHP